MKRMLRTFLHTFFRKELDYRIRLFNVLAMAGALISLAVAVLGTLTVAAPMNSLGCLLSVLLLDLFNSALSSTHPEYTSVAVNVRLYSPESWSPQLWRTKVRLYPFQKNPAPAR
jgi:hypothetical protein